MASKKALLISSPHGGLRGPPNDIQKMATLLCGLGFEISRCDEAEATREGILRFWRALIKTTNPGDAVVIYYSGHGGLVESARSLHGNIRDLDLSMPWRYQFLVPMDFNQTMGSDFRGILDVELSHLLRGLTEKTKNVTVILDCCYAGRMARDPGFGDAAVPKGLATYRFDDVREHVKRLGDQEWLQRDTQVTDNPFVVRIAAAASSEAAWEYQNDRGEWCGVMTEALVRALSESRGNAISWKTTLLRVAEMVNIRFPRQHPHAEGPSSRLQFSILEQEYGDGQFHVKNEADGGVAIQAGYISRIHEGSLYSVWPLVKGNTKDNAPLAEARVTEVSAFKAMVELIPLDQSAADQLAEEGALAVLLHDALPKWPVVLPLGCPWLDGAVNSSRLVRASVPADEDLVLAEFRQTSGSIALYTKSGCELVRTSSDPPHEEEQAVLVMKVEQLARAKHLLALKSMAMEEELEHAVETEIGLVGQNQQRTRIFRQDGTDHLTAGDRVYIALLNRGAETVHAWVLDINVAGKISIVTRSSPRGVELPPGRSEVIGTLRSGELRGKRVKWPEALPSTQPVEETLLFILTSSPIDLSHLAGSNAPHLPAGRIHLSSLEELTYRIWGGDGRDVTVVDDEYIARYALIYAPFLLRPIGDDIQGI